MVKSITMCQHRGTNGRVSISNLAQKRSISKYTKGSFFLSSYIEGWYTTARIKVSPGGDSLGKIKWRFNFNFSLFL